MECQPPEAGLASRMAEAALKLVMITTGWFGLHHGISLDKTWMQLFLLSCHVRRRALVAATQDARVRGPRSM